eukprot:COSAG06_NODE_2511_length_6741_cov_18.812255_5_plen_80_part_00
MDAPCDGIGLPLKSAGHLTAPPAPSSGEPASNPPLVTFSMSTLPPTADGTPRNFGSVRTLASPNLPAWLALNCANSAAE